jgi:hypothetical protein
MLALVAGMPAFLAPILLFSFDQNSGQTVGSKSTPTKVTGAALFFD